MKVSVIIPTFKPDYYLWECLNSVKNQTLTTSIYEVLIILNGEKEVYYSKIESWIKNNRIENFRIVYTSVSGVSNARNLGLNLSSGEYIVFIDDDDYIDSNYLEQLIKKNEILGNESIAITNYLDFDEITKQSLFNSNYTLGEIESNICKKRKSFSIVWMKSIPRSLIGDTRFDVNFKNGEDALFMLEISKKIKNIGVVDQKAFYYRRVRMNSANFKKKDTYEILENTFKLIKEYSKFFLIKGYNKFFIFIRIIAILKGGVYHLSRKYIK